MFFKKLSMIFLGKKTRCEMDQKQSNELASTSSSPNDKNEITVTANAAVTTFQRQDADIFKLDIDCYEELFEYLSLGDLISVGKTCKFLQRIAGYILQLNYKNIGCLAVGKKIFIYDAFRKIDYTNVEHLYGFITTISIDPANTKSYMNKYDKYASHGKKEKILADLSKFRRLRKIVFILWDFYKSDMEANKVIFSKVESLHICGGARIPKGCFHENVLTFFPNLKRLEILGLLSRYRTWLKQTYPTLQSFGIFPSLDIKSCLEIPIFLELNPNIRTFETSSRYIWEYRDSLLTANVKLDNLLIQDSRVDIGTICGLLNELHERGFYKRLHFHYYDGIHRCSYPFSQQKIDQLASLEALVTLHLDCERKNITLSALKNLEELYVDNSKYITDLSATATNLRNLKEIYFYQTSFDDIRTFIHRSMGLRKITLHKPTYSYYVYRYSDYEPIDIVTLNIDRMKLPNAMKTTIYVEDGMFLAIKWAHKETDLSLIRLKRIDSFRCGEDKLWF